METKLDGYWDIIVQQVKERVNANGSAEIREVIKALHENGTLKIDYGYPSDLEIIDGKLKETNQYISHRDREFIHVKKNPSYELDQNIQATNRSVQSLNTTLKRTNIWTVIIAAITGFFIAITFFKNDTKDLQLLNVKLDKQEQILDSMLHYEISKDSAIYKAMRDSALKLR